MTGLSDFLPVLVPCLLGGRMLAGRAPGRLVQTGYLDPFRCGYAAR